MADGGLLMGLASGLKQGVAGYYDGKDRQLKQREMEASIAAKEKDKERQKFLDRLDTRKAGFLIPEGEDVYSAKLEMDPVELEAKALDRRNKEAMIKLRQAQTKKAQADAITAGREAKAPKRWKSSEYTAGQFARRMELAESDLARLLNKTNDKGEKFNPADAMSAAQQADFTIPFTNTEIGLPNYFKSDDVKAYENAKRNFISAVLRKESGAAISPAEFESEEEKYFPEAGDSAETMLQKQVLRRQALEGLKTEAGGAFDQIPSMANNPQGETHPDYRGPQIKQNGVIYDWNYQTKRYE